ncbi:MAG: hypothetical protein V3U17_06115 [Thermoplasmata archaeon]
MPQSLVDRYVIRFRLDDAKIKTPVNRTTNLFMAVEECLSTYAETGHTDYVIEDRREAREFPLDRSLLLRLLYLRTSEEDRYYEILNRLDREGNREDLSAYIARHANL